MGQDGVDTALDTGAMAAQFVPGVGTAIGAGLGIGKGVLDLIKSNREQKKAMGLKPPMEDPEMRGYLSYLERKKRSYETGTAYGRQTAEIGSELANTQAGITQASGGNAGAAITGMTNAQRGAGSAFGKLVENSQPIIAQYEGDIGKTIQDMSDRRLQMQKRNYQQVAGEAAILKKSGTEDIMGGVANLIPMAFPKRTATAASEQNYAPLNPATNNPAPELNRGENAIPFAEQTDANTEDMSDPSAVLSRRRGMPYYNPLQLPQQ